MFEAVSNPFGVPAKYIRNGTNAVGLDDIRLTVVSDHAHCPTFPVGAHDYFPRKQIDCTFAADWCGFFSLPAASREWRRVNWQEAENPANDWPVPAHDLGIAGQQN